MLTPVAVKMGRPTTADDPKTEKRLRAEGERVQSLTHPAFQRLYECRAGDQLPHLVFEYVEGPSLGSLLAANGALAVPDVVAIAEQLAWALAYLHGQGLVHHDLKPSNILLRDGRPVVVDLGLAREIGTQPRTRLHGTAGYHAPEQLAGRPAAASMDVYTLGVVLFELVHGLRPYDARRTGMSECPDLYGVLSALLGREGQRPTASEAAGLLADVGTRIGDEPFCPDFVRLSARKRVLEVGDQVGGRLDADGQADERGVDGQR